MTCRDYKNSDNATFRSDIIITTSNVDSYGMYKNTVFNIFNRHIPIKKRYICTNEAPFLRAPNQQTYSRNIELTLTKKLQNSKKSLLKSFEKH